MEFLTALLTYVIGYWWGKRVGQAQTMIRMQAIMADLQKIQNLFKQWNEDQL